MNNHQFDLPHHPADLDSKPQSNIFDDLDSNLLDMSPSQERKDSFATSNAFFSPQTSTNPWGDETFPTSNQDRHMSISSHFEHSNNPFINAQYANSVGWNFERSEAKTPISATYEPFTGEFDAPAFSNGNSGFNMGMLNNVRPASVMPPVTGSGPLSASPAPQSGKEWMALAEQDLDSGRLPKRIRQTSPPRPLTPGFARRDGVRKKNARFEIPEGRNLHNIDRLIEQATTEDDVKELKQQKRLLRNRQAALDSRQRKKKHTEELEKEQKAWHEHRSELDVKFQIMEQEFEALKMQSAQLEQHNHELAQQVHSLTHEKEQMVETHTLETGELRKRISILAEQLDRPEQSLPTADFVDFTQDLDGLSMGDWGNYIMVDDLEDSPKVPSTGTSLIVGKPRKDTLMDDSNPTASGGFLLMLLLYGAIVASKSNGTTAPPMPGMSDEMRAASAHIVDNILKDGPQPSNALVQATRASMQAAPSMPAWIQPDSKPNVVPSVFPAASQPSAINTFATQIIHSSKEAEAEAAFGLTAAQYNSITSGDFGDRRMYDDDAPSPSSHRKTLTETLKQMRDDARGASVSDVYTRSLMWDRIPDHVLQDFRRIVDDSQGSTDDSDVMI